MLLSLLPLCVCRGDDTGITMRTWSRDVFFIILRHAAPATKSKTMVRVARAPGPHRTDRPRHAKKQCHSRSEEVSRRDERGETQDAHSIVRVLSALGCGRMVCHESRLGMCFEPHSWRGRGAGAGAPHRPQSEIRPGALGILRVPGLPPQTSRGASRTDRRAKCQPQPVRMSKVQFCGRWHQAQRFPLLLGGAAEEPKHEQN